MNYDLRSGSLTAPDTVIAASSRRVSHAVTRVYPHAVPAITAPPVKTSTVSLGYATNANRAPPTATKTSPQKTQDDARLGAQWEQRGGYDDTRDQQDKFDQGFHHHRDRTGRTKGRLVFISVSRQGTQTMVPSSMGHGRFFEKAPM